MCANVFNIYFFLLFVDPRMKELWLMDSPWPILIILIGYLYFVLKAGPEFMKSRGPLNIDRIVMVYNITQISLSFYMVKKVIVILNTSEYIHFLLNTFSY